MEKELFNGFDSQEKLDTITGMVNSALFALADTTMVEFIPATQVVAIYAGYGDYTLDLTLNLFDGVCMVEKWDDDGQDIGFFDKRDLDIIRRVDAISEQLIDAVYVHEYTEGKSGGSWSRSESETEDETETETKDE